MALERETDIDTPPLTGDENAVAVWGQTDERFRILMENLEVGVSVSTLNGRMIYANREILRMTGHESMEEFLSVPAVERYGSSAEREAFVSELLAKGMVRHLEMRSVRKDGSRYWISMNARVLKDRDGNPELILASILDITERRLAQRRLQESEARFRQLFELSPARMVLVGTNLFFVGANRAFCEMLGYSEPELQKMTFSDVTHPDDREAGINLARQALKGEIEGFQLEKRYLRRDGTVVWGLVSSALLRDEDGDPLYFMTQIQDISERKKAEEALRESEERLRAIIQNEPECVKLLDREGRVLEMNPAGLDIIQGTAERVFGQKAVGLVAPEDRAAFSDMVDAVFQGQRRSLVFDMIGLMGRRRTLETVSVPLRGARGEGAVTALLGVTRDITDKKVMEERLRHSEKMEAIGQLAGGVAHDFNNMLHAILGNAEMILATAQDGRTLSYAQAIIASAQRSASLTNQLLAFARRGKFQTLSVDVHTVIEDVIELLGHSLDKRIVVRRELSAGRHVVTGDPSQLHNALLNLALNARDAMPEGGTLTFETAALEDDELLPPGVRAEGVTPPLIRIDVSDTGTGLSEEARSHLFEPFFTTKRPGKGTGLGLASVYGTAKGHGGSVTAEAGTETGTRFSLFLPLSEGGAVVEPDTEPAPSVPAVGAQRILVAEDEAALRRLLRETLKFLGYEAVVAADGAEAVEIYRSEWRNIDLVILDVIMPVMGGYETLLELKAINPGVKAIVTSGYALDDEVQRILNLGAVGFVQKPFRAAELSVELARALES